MFIYLVLDNTSQQASEWMELDESVPPSVETLVIATNGGGLDLDVLLPLCSRRGTLKVISLKLATVPFSGEGACLPSKAASLALIRSFV